MEKSYTQQHLAELCDVNIRTIQRVEKDGTASQETTMALATVFDLNAVDLFYKVDAWKDNAPIISLSKYLIALFLGVVIGFVLAQ